MQGILDIDSGKITNTSYSTLQHLRREYRREDRRLQRCIKTLETLRVDVDNLPSTDEELPSEICKAIYNYTYAKTSHRGAKEALVFIEKSLLGG